MPAAPPVPEGDFPPERIEKIRKALGLSLREFGLELYDYGGKAAYDQAYRLKEGKLNPSAAVRRTLYRLEEEAEQKEKP